MSACMCSVTPESVSMQKTFVTLFEHASLALFFALIGTNGLTLDVVLQVFS